MSNFATPNRPGEAQGGGADPYELFLKVFSGEVMVAARNKTTTEGIVTEKNITSGKSAQFMVVGRTTGGYHATAGADLDPAAVNHGEIIINVDRPYVHSVFLDDLDQYMAHWQDRAPLVEDFARGLMERRDNVQLREIGIGAKVTADVVTDRFAGTDTILAATDTDEAVLTQGFFGMAQKFDEKLVDSQNRVAFLLPAQYYLLVFDRDSAGAVPTQKSANRDYGGVGNIATGTIPMLAGWEIRKTTNFIAQNYNTQLSGERNDYRVNLANATALFAHRTSLGRVQLMGINSQQQSLVRNQGVLLVSRMAEGYGAIRPEACGLLRTA